MVAFYETGYGSHVFHECYVTTDSRFNDFEYDGVNYHRVERKADIEVIQQGNVRVTSIEQTVVDGIRDYEKIAGLEEVIRCLIFVPELNEEKFLRALNEIKRFLYQNYGYLFEQLKDKFGFSDKFYEKYAVDKLHLYIEKESVYVFVRGDSRSF